MALPLPALKISAVSSAVVVAAMAVPPVTGTVLTGARFTSLIVVVADPAVPETAEPSALLKAMEKSSSPSKVPSALASSVKVSDFVAATFSAENTMRELSDNVPEAKENSSKRVPVPSVTPIVADAPNE